ncbi:MAG: LPXTG cell wall anchor domain-containing protein [Solobacterium sp.]|nr:LPXTG cell wall anchor domain-containing protein [Solobacterium sp.]
MKLIKKIAAIMFAFMMVVSMSCNVKANEGASLETTGTLTINKVKKNQTYKLYKILDLESFSGDNYSYTIATGWEDFFKNEGEGAAYMQNNENGYISFKEGMDAEDKLREFAQKALEYANSKTLKPTKTYTTSEGQTSITDTGLALGYYLLDSSVGTLCSLSSSQPNVTIDEKNDVPSVSKTFDNGKTTNNASIGDVITFNTVVNVKKGAQSYVLHDKMSAGLKLNQKLNAANDKQVLITKDNHKVLTFGTDFIFTETTDGFTIKFSEAFLKRFEDKDYTLLVMYSATLTDAAVIGGAGNTNETYLTYGVDSESNHSTTTTKTFEMNVFKYTENKTDNTKKDGLAGAVFTLKKDGETNTINFASEKTDEINGDVYRVAKTDDANITTNKSGKFTIKGLGAGTYYLTETKQPDGYNKLKNPVTVVIDNDGNVKVDGANADPVKVLNKTGTVLPSTGGAGTTMIYLAGAVLVLGSGVVLATKRRVKNK